MALGLGSSLIRGGASLLTYVKDNLKLYLDFKSSRSDTLAFPSDGSTSFDGTDDYIQVSPIPTTSATGSVCAWVKNSADSGEAILTFGDANANSYFGISIGDGSTGLVSNELVVISRTVTDTHSRAGFATTGSGRNILVDGDWHHVAVTGDGSEYKIYIDGVSQSINVTSGDGNNGAWTNVTGVDEFYIGKHRANGGDAIPFEGKMANVALWSRVLSEEEINSVMNKSYSQLGSVEKTSLEAWWALDDIFLGKTTNVSDYVTSGYTIAKIIENKASLISDNLIPDGEFETGISNFSSADNGVLSYNSDKNLVITGSGGTGSATISSVTLEVSTEYIFEIALAGGTDNDSIQFRLDESALGSTSYGNIYSVASQGTNSSPKKVSLKFKSDSSATGFFLKITNINDTKTAIISSVKLFKASGYGASIGATTTTSVYGGNAPILPRAIDIAESQAEQIGNGSITTSSGGYVDLGNPSIIHFKGSFSVGCWFKTTDATASNEIIMSVNNDGVNSGWLLKLNGSRKLEFGLDLGLITDGGSASNDGEWHHVVGVHESGVGNKLYKNGILVASNTTGTSLSNHIPNFHIGNQDYSTPRALDGSYAQAFACQGVLTQAQIQSVMESTSYAKIPADVKSTTSTLVTLGDWTLSGSWVYDSSIGHYTNTYVNGTDTPVGNILASPTTTQGNLYKLSYTVVSATGSPTLKFPNNMLGLSSANIPYTVGETNVHYGVDGGSNENIGIRSSTGVGTIVLKDVKFEEVTNDLVAYYPLDADSSNTSNGTGITNDLTTGETLSEELVGDPSFDTDSSANITISNTTDTEVINGALKYTDGSLSEVTFLKSSANILTSGDLYKLVFTIADADGSGARIAFSFMPTSIPNYDHTNYLDGTHTIYFNADQANALMNISGASPSFKMTDVSIKEVTSNTGVLK